MPLADINDEKDGPGIVVPTTNSRHEVILVSDQEGQMALFHARKRGELRARLRQTSVVAKKQAMVAARMLVLHQLMSTRSSSLYALIQIFQ
mmetsp:Transcript_13371/g.27705  ORF Transcript_13371/g.27705 Transcript_13371/m.27705 type:complete len:91 (+) Transcript_13371:290-562(+)